MLKWVRATATRQATGPRSPDFSKAGAAADRRPQPPPSRISPASNSTEMNDLLHLFMSRFFPDIVVVVKTEGGTRLAIVTALTPPPRLTRPQAFRPFQFRPRRFTHF
jgi:hypothetical protein